MNGKHPCCHPGLCDGSCGALENITPSPGTALVVREKMNLVTYDAAPTTPTQNT